MKNKKTHQLFDIIESVISLGPADRPAAPVELERAIRALSELKRRFVDSGLNR